MFDLAHLTLEDVVHCGGIWQRAAAPGRSLEEAAAAIVRHIYHDVVSGGERAFVLVRLFATQSYGDLPADLREFARRLADDRPLSTDQKCLVLMATAGDQPDWNDRSCSKGHKAIPLESGRLASRFPMISQLLAQLGARINPADGAIVLDRAQREFNVFYVRDAEGSPHVVDQEGFVRPFAVRSVVGFGGSLPSGEHFAVVAFARATIAREVADLFRYLALNVKLALLPFDLTAYLEGGKAARPPTVHDVLTTLSVEGATAGDLLRTYVTIAADWLDRSRVLTELTGRLASTRDVDAAVEAFCGLVAPRVADGVSVDLSGGPIRRLLHLDQTTVLSNLREETELREALAGAGSAIAIPLRARGQAFGVVAMRWASPHVFEPMFISYVEELANRFAIALDNARLDAATRAERQRAKDEAAFAERLLAIVSHDLRNPLTAILLASRLLAGGRLEAEHMRLARQIVRSSERMTRLIGQLLDFARLHRGMSLPMYFEPAHLHEIADRIVEEVRHSHEGAVLEIAELGRDDLVCDVVGMESVLANLLYNAVQHGVSGPVTVTIRDGGSGHIAFDVHNFGFAIPDQVRAVMFEAFRRGAREDTRTKSLGLGLFIAREIVRAHGGTISVRSTDREGTTFSVLLPRQPRELADAEPPAAHH
jgi:signal transduction histidine kinase